MGRTTAAGRSGGLTVRADLVLLQCDQCKTLLALTPASLKQLEGWAYCPFGHRFEASASFTRPRPIVKQGQLIRRVRRCLVDARDPERLEAAVAAIAGLLEADPDEVEEMVRVLRGGAVKLVDVVSFVGHFR